MSLIKSSSRLNAIRNPEGIWINSKVFCEEADHFQKYGYYIKDPEGSPAFTEYWSEQLNRCINGYEVMASDLYTTHYKNGVPIPNITDDTDWSNDTDGAMCWYDNEPHVVPPIPDDQIPQYYLVTDGSTIYRKGVRNQAFVIDIALTALGFGGIEDIDWQNLQTII